MPDGIRKNSWGLVCRRRAQGEKNQQPNSADTVNPSYTTLSPERLTVMIAKPKGELSYGRINESVFL